MMEWLHQLLKARFAKKTLQVRINKTEFEEKIDWISSF